MTSMSSAARAPLPQPPSRQVLLPEGWPEPRGYSNGVAAEGRMVFIGGQVGWNAAGEFPDDFVGQVKQTLENILAVLAVAGGAAENIVRMTWYVRDMDEYLANLKPLGRAYREVMGANYPAMALVQVVRLVEPPSRVEIEATAVL